MNAYRKIIVLSVFWLSGAAALIYEVVWSRSLQFIFGSTIETVSSIFAVFLLGFALGAFLFRDMADKTKRPIFYLALFEIGIGLYGLLMPDLVRLSAIIYYRCLFDSFIFKVILFLLLILIPTTLLGAIWPFISRYYVQRSDNVGARIGSLYSINSLGSALGAVLSGFILIPFFGLNITSFIAASFNLIAGILIFFVKENHNEE